METKTYLIETFEYNSSTNRKLLEKIELLPDREESIKLFSHLINCQYKWLARILKTAGYEKMDWWIPVYDVNKLEEEWNKSTRNWFDYLNTKTDDQLAAETNFIGYDGSLWPPRPKTLLYN